MSAGTSLDRVAPRLSAGKRELVDLLLAERRRREGGADRAATPELVPDPAGRHHPFPLTDLQRAYWVGRAAGLELGDVSVHCYLEVDCAGLDLGRFTAAWRRLVDRHDMLRAEVLEDGRQRIRRRLRGFAVPVADLAALAPEGAEARLAGERRRLRRHRLGAGGGPLFLVRACRLPGGRTRLQMAFDGLILDGWSYHLLFSELIALYRDPEAALPELALSFRDYALAAAARRDGAGHRTALAYWQERLPGLPGPPELPLVAAARTGPHPGFERRSFALDPVTWTALKRRASGAGLTATGALLAAFAEVVAAWSAGPRFRLGLPRFNRLPLHPQVDRLVGEFASFSLLEVDASGRLPFRLRARRLQARLWRDLEHSQVGGAELLRRLAGGGGQTPAAPVVFTSTLGLAGSDAAAPLADLGEVVHRVTQTPQVWLDALVYESGGELRCDWDAVAGLFPPGLVDDMLDAYRRLLVDLAGRDAAWEEPPEAPVPPAQRELTAAVNATAAPFPDLSLDALVLRRAARQPDSAAVLAGGETLTYGELERRSRRWAGVLRRLGAGGGRTVAVVMEKGREQVVAVLAAARAGAAFLPLDPGLPGERLGALLAEGEASLALTQARLDRELPWPPGVRRLPIDAGEPAGAAPEAPPPGSRPEDLAYVLYTSGSTGRPKGVMVGHRGMVNAVVATERRFAVGTGDRALAVTPLVHDMALYDLFGPLAAGGALVLPDPSRGRDPGHWLDLMERHRVTLWNSVPAMMEMLLEVAAARGRRIPASLRLAFLGGDWIPVSLPGRLAAAGSAARVVSVGGPTETTLWNVWYPVEEVDPGWRSIPYGRPIANARYRVLDRELRDRPLWVPGELCCAGVGLALGYWRAPALTARRFLPDAAGGRLYRTGDLGRYLPSGDIEILGRIDRQVQVNGVRVEPAEIEAALARHPGVEAAVVTPAAGSARRLVAHVVRRAAASRRLELKLGEAGRRRLGGERRAVALPRPAGDADRAARRRSHRRFRTAPLPLAALAALLGALREVPAPGAAARGVAAGKRRYPSAGGLYPVSVYLEVKPDRVAQLPAGAYAYHPAGHRLVRLAAGAATRIEHHLEVNRRLFRGAAFSLYLVADLAAVEPLYGRWSRDFCLLEAGAMGQLLMERAAGFGLGLCPIGRLDFAAAGRRLALGEGHRLVHTLVGGAVDPGWSEEPPVPGEAGTAVEGGAEAAGTTAEALRAWLRDRLPEALVPAGVCFHEALPLTANGKVDRAALARRVPPSRGPAGRAPRSRLERAVAALWRQALGLPRVGADDNFFDLGGTSVELVGVYRRLCRELDRGLPVTALFRHPTVASLAAFLAGEPGGGDLAETVAGRLAQRRAAGGRPRRRSERGGLP